MNTNRTIAIYGEKTDLVRMAGRIRSLMPGGNRLSNEQAMALAQVAMIHGLDPFNGEVWYIIDDNGKSLGIQIGIKGLRKKAHQQVKGNYWTSPRALTDPQEREMLLIKPGELAFETRLYDTETFNTYTAAVKQLRDAGIPYESVVKILGEAPYTLGYGVFKPGERTKMTPVQCAMKRSESHAIKQRFDVPFEVIDSDEPSVPPEAAIDGEFVEAADTQTGEVVSIAPTAALRDVAADTRDLFAEKQAAGSRPVVPDWYPSDLIDAEKGTPATPAARPQPAPAPSSPKTNGTARPPQVVRQALVAFATRTPTPAGEELVKKAASSLSTLVEGSDPNRHAVMAYLFDKPSTKDFTAGECLAVLQWIGLHKVGDAWQPAAVAVTEAQAMLGAYEVERGQIQMPVGK